VLGNLEPKPPVQRYEREWTGDLIHIDVKTSARLCKAGHRITGNRQQGRSTGVGYDRVHVAIDDAHGWLTSRFWLMNSRPRRAFSWFKRQGVECCQVMNDNGPD